MVCRSSQNHYRKGCAANSVRVFNRLFNRIVENLLRVYPVANVSSAP